MRDGISLAIQKFWLTVAVIYLTGIEYAMFTNACVSLERHYYYCGHE